MTTHQIERIWLWFFPRRCVWCMDVTEPDHMLCADCIDIQAQQLEPTHIENTQFKHVAVFSYHSKARRILLNVKYHGGRKNAYSIGYAMADALRKAKPAEEDFLFCAVPMTKKQLKKREFNQSELLAKSAAKWLDASHAPLLHKTRETQAQHDLPAHKRTSNVTGAYIVTQPKLVKNRKIVLCDDICTTGATMRVCANALQDAGAKEVICLSYLRTDLDKERVSENTRASNRR